MFLVWVAKMCPTAIYEGFSAIAGASSASSWVHIPSQPSTMNGQQIGAIQIFLAEAHTIGTVFDRQLPVIIDEQPRPILLTQSDGGGGILFYLFTWPILNA